MKGPYNRMKDRHIETLVWHSGPIQFMACRCTPDGGAQCSELAFWMPSVMQPFLMKEDGALAANSAVMSLL